MSNNFYLGYIPSHSGNLLTSTEKAITQKIRLQEHNKPKADKLIKERC